MASSASVGSREVVVDGADRVETLDVGYVFFRDQLEFVRQLSRGRAATSSAWTGSERHEERCKKGDEIKGRGQAGSRWFGSAVPEVNSGADEIRR